MVHSAAIPVVGFEDFYSVTSSGEIISLRLGRPLKPFRLPKGYLVVTLMSRGVEYKRYVHRIVAEAFHGMREDLQVNHIDGDKQNNRPENLEWVSVTENIRHAFRIGLHSRTKRGSK